MGFREEWKNGTGRNAEPVDLRQADGGGADYVHIVRFIERDAPHTRDVVRDAVGAGKHAAEISTRAQRGTGGIEFRDERRTAIGVVDGGVLIAGGLICTRSGRKSGDTRITHDVRVARGIGRYT